MCGDFFQLPPVPEKSRKCPRCDNDQWTKLDPSDSTLEYEQLPVGVVTAPIVLCADRTIGGKLHKGCGLELRRRNFVFETETWAECQFKVMELTKVSRARTETVSPGAGQLS